MRTVLCHFFNEEYLLPWWLKHHRSMFDHGVLIDHGSTDNSLDICRQLVPEWRIVRSRLTAFDPFLTDFEVMCYEQELPGWKITLNVTEFLLTHYPLDHLETYLTENQKKGARASGILVVDMNPRQEPDVLHPLPPQYFWGIEDNSFINVEQRVGLGIGETPLRNRFYHCLPVGMYTPGRHDSFHPDAKLRINDLMIFHYGYAPWTDRGKQRKLQISQKMPAEVRINDWGAHHLRDSKRLDLDHQRISAAATDLRLNEYTAMALDYCDKHMPFD